MKKFKLICFLTVLIVSVSFIFFLYFTHKTQAQSVNAVSGTASIINSVGYKIYFSSTDNGSPLGGTSGNIPYSVQYNPSTLGMTGYAWSPEYGWIQFNGATATALSFVGVNDTESPTDWAKGLIKLTGTDGGTTANILYKVFFDPLTGVVDTTNHWAWGGNVIGWVDFSGVSVALAGVPSCTLTATPSAINSGDSSLLIWYGSNLASCSASGAWSGSQPISGGPLNTGALTTSTTYTLSCLGTNGANTQCSTTITVVDCSTNPIYPLCCSVNPTNPACVSTHKVCVSGSCVSVNGAGSDTCTNDSMCTIVTPISCTLAEMNNTENLPCYCPAHPTEVTPVDCVTFCLNNPSACKKIPHYIEN